MDEEKDLGQEPASGYEVPAKDEEVKHGRDRRTEFNFGRIFIGLFLVVIGFIYLANSLGILNVSFSLRWSHIWPVIIILVGLSMLSGRGWFGALIGFIFTLAVVALIAYVIFTYGTTGGTDVKTSSISISREAGIDEAEIGLKLGAGSINLVGGTNKLVSGTHKSNFIKLETDSSVDDSIQKVKIEGKGDWAVIGRNYNDLNLRLNSNIPVSLSMDTGASDMDLDFSEIRAELIEIDAGASTMDVELGDKVRKSELSIDAGASTVNIVIPKTLGVKLRVDAGVSSKNFEDFERQNDKQYISRNYDKTDKKVDVFLDVGVSSLNVTWK